MSNLDYLILIRITGLENGAEFLFKSLLIKDKFDPNRFYSPISKVFCEKNTQQITLNELGYLKDYFGYETEGPFSLGEEGNKIINFIQSKQVFDFLESGGGLFIDDENFDEFKYTFQIEDNQAIGLSNAGEIIKIQLDD